MEEFQRIFRQYWLKISLFLGLGLVFFIFFGKFFIWFLAKGVTKLIGLALIGIGLLFRKFKQKKSAATL